MKMCGSWQHQEHGLLPAWPFGLGFWLHPEQNHVEEQEWFVQGPLCRPGTLCLQPSAPSARQELGAGCGMEPAWCWGERTILHVQELLQNHRGWWGWGGTPGGDLDRTLPHQGSVEPLAQPQVLVAAGDPTEEPKFLEHFFLCVESCEPGVSQVGSGKHVEVGKKVSELAECPKDQGATSWGGTPAAPGCALQTSTARCRFR